MLDLLARMKAEAERNCAAIEALDKEQQRRSRHLAGLNEFNTKAEAELAEIEHKSRTSAGHARAHVEVLAAEQRYERCQRAAKRLTLTLPCLVCAPLRLV